MPREEIVEKKQDLWRCIDRVDAYINAANFKSGFLATINVGLLGAMMAGIWPVTVTVSGGLSFALHGLIFVLFLTFFVGAGFALWNALGAVRPNLGSPSATIYCMPYVGKLATGEGQGKSSFDAIKKSFFEASQDDDAEALADQFWDLSVVAQRKFAKHEKSVWWTSRVMMPALVGVLVVHAGLSVVVQPDGGCGAADISAQAVGGHGRYISPSK